MVLFDQQLKSLVWKNYILQKRRPWSLAAQLALPPLFFIIFGVIRLTLLTPEKGKTIPENPSFSIPSLEPFFSNGQFGYIPNNVPEVGQVVDNIFYYACQEKCAAAYVNFNTTCIDTCQSSIKKTAIGFKSNVEMQNYLEKNTNAIWAAVVFVDENGKEIKAFDKKSISYQLRLDGTELPLTSEVYQTVEIGPTESGEEYLSSGYVSLQVAVDTCILWLLDGNSLRKSITVLSQEFPYPDYVSSDFYLLVRDSLAFYVCLSFLVFIIRLETQIVGEKENKIKECMKIMGLKDYTYWMSWFISSLFVMVPTMTFTSIAAKVFTILEESDFIIIFFFFQTWGLSIISFCFIISVAFDKAKVASSAGAILLFLSLLPDVVVSTDSSTGAQFGACLLSSSCMALGLEKFFDYEELKIGITWDNITEGDFSFMAILLTMLLDVVIYFFLAWYLEQVLPGTYGIKREWNFIFKREFWSQIIIDHKTIIPTNRLGEKKEEVADGYEAVSAEMQENLSVHISDLFREFEYGTGEKKFKKVAVSGLNVKMYDGQIFALLGHNGAGKSTTMNILTGMTLPTSGDATIYGMSILNRMEAIRSRIGYCPQTNITWDDLTVKEHVYIYASLKGVAKEDLEAHVNERIKEVGMVEKVDYLSKSLSGGQKRKLCVSIAFTGGTRLIFLDEPTSGMDPYSRRSIWDLLQNMKTGRTIVLTTHFMDEADLLGDRIGIMNGGRIVACGSSLFLKSRYGVGYTLTMVKLPTCQDQEVTRYISKRIPEVKLFSNVGAEISYVLPLHTMQKFGEFFEDFETRKKDLGIESFGISVTTLEEVFLRLAQQPQAAKGDSHGIESRPKEPHTIVQVEKPSGSSHVPRPSANLFNGGVPIKRSFMQQVKGLMIKRIIVYTRDLKSLLQILFYASIFVLVAIVVSEAITSERNNDLYQLSFDKFKDENEFVVSNSSPSTDILGLLTTFYRGAKINFVEKSLAELNPYLLGDEDIHGAAVLNSVDNVNRDFNYTALYDTNAYHSLPTVINVLNNAIIRNLTGNDVSIKVSNYPLPVFDFSGTDYGRSFTLAIYIAIAACIIPGSLMSLLAKEVEVKCYHQQLVCGTHPAALWLTYFISDLFVYAIFSILIFIIFLGSGTDAFIDENFKGTVLLFTAYGFAAFPFAYVVSKFAKSPTTIQSKVTTMFIILAIGTLVIVNVLYSNDSTFSAAESIDYLFSTIPPYAVAAGIFFLSINEIAAEVPGQEKLDVLEWDVVGRPVTFLFCEFVFYFLILAAIELGYVDKIYEKFSKSKQGEIQLQSDVSPTYVDDDVAQEQTRIEMNDALTDSLIVTNLRKVFTTKNASKVAVKKLSFGIPEGECFGLLGPNGAGKTTTLSILSGDMAPTSGNVWLKGNSILESKSIIFQDLSFCPQFDPLLDLMTGREHLWLFARLKGVAEEKIAEIVDGILEILELSVHADKPTQNYSGGNKRKLSLGIAMLGDPKILFLDEPSSGMDPLARRRMWNVISSFVVGRSIILTTHSMEECEALCSRIGIMVHGEMKCLGSPQHLKAKFGGGYRLEIQCHPDSVGELKDFILATYPSAVLLEWHKGKLRYQIPGSELSLSTVFHKIEQKRQILQIQDYALSQTTLEQVFVNFAREQEQVEE